MFKAMPIFSNTQGKHEVINQIKNKYCNKNEK